MTTQQSNGPENNPDSGLSFLRHYVAFQKPLLRKAVFFGALSTVLTIAQWLSFAYISEQVLVFNTPLFDLNFGLALLFLTGLIRPFFSRLQTKKSQQASLNIRDEIRYSLLKQWNLTSPVKLHRTSVGSLATQWIEDVEAMDGYFSRYWPQQALAIVSPLLILFVVAYLNWLCAVFLLITAPLIPLFMVLVGMGAEQVNQKYSLLRQRLAGHFLDRVANLSTIKLLNANKIIGEEVAERSRSYRKVIMKTLKLAFLSSTVLEFFTSVAIATLAIYIGFSLYGAINWGPANSLTLFSGLAILLLAPEFFKPLKNLSQYYHDRASAVGAAGNIGLTQGVEKRVYSHALQDPLSEVPEVLIELAGIVGGYKGKGLSHQPINQSISPSHLIVISGESGTGKTTLLNTIAGYLKPHSGQIKVYAEEHFPIAYLPQKAWIKNTTVKQNIAVVAPHASDEDMLEVLDKLGLCTELLDLHQGLETMIGEHGQGLSGGQMQRIALARVMLDPSRLILLDEPTASLDVRSKQLIIHSLLELKRNSAIVISSHDPAVIELADIHIHLTNEHSN